MSTDKRSVNTDALETLGYTISENEKRDAIHLAVEPVVAGEALIPGNHVKLLNSVAHKAPTGQGVGIVDPFLENVVRKGERFWLVVYPRKITSLRHVWTHPAFPEPEGSKSVEEQKHTPGVIPPLPDTHKLHQQSVSEQWLRDFCTRNDVPPYETVMDAIKGTGSVHVNKDYEYWTFIGIDAHCEIPKEFWEHVENVLGKTVSDKPEYFSCSC